jgi:DNA-binding MarR family transcriptional regulator
VSSHKSSNPPTETAALLLGVSMMFMKKLTASMRQSDLHIDPAQGGILARLAEGSCRMSDLAQHQCVQLPTISRSVSRLVERRYVERWVPEDNRRITMVSLTPEGRRVIDALMGEAQSNTESLLRRLSGKECAELRHALEVLRSALLPLENSD